MRRFGLLATALLLGVARLPADDLRGAGSDPVPATSVSACVDGADCTKVDSRRAEPAALHRDRSEVPTTQDHARQRPRPQTDIKNLQRVNGMLILQGYEWGGRSPS